MVPPAGHARGYLGFQVWVNHYLHYLHYFALLALLAFQLLVLSGFVGTVVDVVVGSFSSHKRGVPGCGSWACRAEFDITPGQDVSGHWYAGQHYSHSGCRSGVS